MVPWRLESSLRVSGLLGVVPYAQEAADSLRAGANRCSGLSAQSRPDEISEKVRARGHSLRIPERPLRFAFWASGWRRREPERVCGVWLNRLAKSLRVFYYTHLCLRAIQETGLGLERLRCSLYWPWYPFCRGSTRIRSVRYTMRRPWSVSRLTLPSSRRNACSVPSALQSSLELSPDRGLIPSRGLVFRS